MTDITDLIQLWSSCCNDVWRRWFSNRSNGAYEFVEIEEKLLEILLTGQVEPKEQVFAPQEFIKRLRIQYAIGVNDIRQICTQQKAGNIFGNAESVTIPKDSIHAVQGIDTMGTMLDSGPYVEVEWKNGFLLEPIQNLKFFLITP